MSLETSSLRSEQVDPTLNLLAVNCAGSTLTKSQSCNKLDEVSQLGERTTIRKSWDGFKDVLASVRRKKKTVEEIFSNDLNLALDAYMEEILEAIIKKKNIKRVTWLDTKNGEGHQVLFNLESGPRCEDTIRLLSEWGVGEREGTSVSVLPCTLYHEPIHDPLEEKPPE